MTEPFPRRIASLRLELRCFGIRVSTVEPGAIQTPAVDKTLGHMEAVLGDLPASGAGQYGEMLQSFVARAYAREMKGSSPDVVARAVHHALTARRPRIRYRVGKHAKFLAALPTLLPDSVLDALVLRMVGVPAKFGTLVSARNRRPRKRAA